MPATNYPEFNAAVTELTDRVELLLTDVGNLQSVASVQVAVDKAAEASTSATAAASSATAANGSKTAAASSATAAASSATAANTSKVAAASSATAADSSKTAAAASATTASTAATSAGNSVTASDASKVAATNSATAADSSKTAAAGSATAAASSATAASSSSTKASQWADAAENTVVETGKYSAKHHATKAAASATAANTSKVAAEAARDTAVAAAASLTGSLVEVGSIDLSGGTYPAIPPVSSFWKVTVGGTAGGVPYGVGDTLVYSKTLTQFYKIDNTESVSSVNGQSGAVLVEPVIAAGTPAQLWLGNKTWATVLSQVHGTLMTGLNLTVATAVVAGDNLLAAVGKLQKQITDASTNMAANVRATLLAGYLEGSNAALVATDSVLAAFGKVQAQLNAKAPLVSPSFTGTPLVPTAADGTSTGQAASTAFVQAAVGGYLAKAVTGGTVTLTAAEASNPVIGLSGALTSNLILEIPVAALRIYSISNGTTGAFTVSIKVVGLTPVVPVAQGKRNLIYTNGVGAYDAINDFDAIALTGVSTCTTAAVGTNTTQVASTAYTVAEIGSRAPTKEGVGATGSWPISVTGAAATLTGLTPTVAELNYIDGVTSAVQTQLNGKVNLAGGNMTGDLIYQNVGVGGWARGLTAKIQSTAAAAAGIGFLGNADSVSTVYLGFGPSPWSSGNGVRVTAAGVTISGATTFDTLITGSVNGNAATATTLTGLTTTVAELNYMDGVTSAVQTQLGSKLPLAGGTMTGEIIAQNSSSGSKLSLRSSADGIAATEWMSFLQSSGTRDGYVGVPNPATTNMYLFADTGDVLLYPNLGSSILYEAGAPKLETTPTGVTVTGTVVATAFTGVASSATTLTGLTPTVAELNFVDGVTSAIQTQLNGKKANETDSGWLTPTLVSSFTVTDVANPIKYRKVGNRVYITGSVKRAAATGWGALFTTLPVGYRPLKQVESFSQKIADDMEWTVGVISVNTDGAMQLGLTSGSTAANAIWTIDIVYEV